MCMTERRHKKAVKALASAKICWIGNVEVTKMAISGVNPCVAVSIEEAAKEGKF